MAAKSRHEAVVILLLCAFGLQEVTATKLCQAVLAMARRMTCTMFDTCVVRRSLSLSLSFFLSFSNKLSFADVFC
jgi:hypothetical protein